MSEIWRGRTNPSARALSPNRFLYAAPPLRLNRCVKGTDLPGSSSGSSLCNVSRKSAYSFWHSEHAARCDSSSRYSTADNCPIAARAASSFSRSCSVESPLLIRRFLDSPPPNSL
jgi:hypothetical protein